MQRDPEDCHHVHGTDPEAPHSNPLTVPCASSLSPLIWWTSWQHLTVQRSWRTSHFHPLSSKLSPNMGNRDVSSTSTKLYVFRQIFFQVFISQNHWSQDKNTNLLRIKKGWLWQYLWNTWHIRGNKWPLYLALALWGWNCFASPLPRLPWSRQSLNPVCQGSVSPRPSHGLPMHLNRLCPLITSITAPKGCLALAFSLPNMCPYNPQQDFWCQRSHCHTDQNSSTSSQWQGVNFKL